MSLSEIAESARQQMRERLGMHIERAVNRVMRLATTAAKRGESTVSHDYYTHSNEETGGYAGVPAPGSIPRGPSIVLHGNTEFQERVRALLVAKDPSLSVRFAPIERRFSAKTSLRITVEWATTEAPSALLRKRARSSNVALTCPICLEDTPANVVVPCGHHVCEACVPSIQRCPVCRGRVGAVQPVFGTVASPAE